MKTIIIDEQEYELVPIKKSDPLKDVRIPVEEINGCFFFKSPRTGRKVFITSAPAYAGFKYFWYADGFIDIKPRVSISGEVRWPKFVIMEV